MANKEFFKKNMYHSSLKFDPLRPYITSKHQNRKSHNVIMRSLFSIFVIRLLEMII